MGNLRETDTAADQFLELGGRRFYCPADRTARNDQWVAMLAGDMGLHDVQVGEDEDAEAFAYRVQATCLRDGRVYDLLGGLMLPEGVSVTSWTPQLAAETGEFLGNLTAPADKAALNASIAGALAGFFRAGLASAMTSARYSQRRDESDPDQSEGATIAASGPR